MKAGLINESFVFVFYVAGLTLGATQSWIADAGVLVVSEVEESTAVVSVQKDALVNHPFNNVWDKSGITFQETVFQCVPKHSQNNRPAIYGF